MRKRRPVAWLLIVSLALMLVWRFLWSDSATAPASPGMAQYVVWVSIDALREQDLDLLAKLPNIGSLIQGGVSAPVRCIYPSNTYPSHATIATGVRPYLHGVVDNMMVQPEKHPSPDWYWWASALRVPAIWDIARTAGLKTGAILWPVSAGARIDYLFPEIQANDKGECLPLLVLRYGTPILILRLILNYGVKVLFGCQPSLDDFVANSAITILKNYRPNLLMVHLLEVDFARHKNGPEGPEVEASLRRQDRRIGQIIAAATSTGIADRTVFVITGDHSTCATKHLLNLNIAFRQEGLLTVDRNGHIVSWRAYALHSGGTSEVYLSDPQDANLREKVARLLNKLARDPANGISAVRTGEQEAKRRGASPEPSFYVELSPGWAMGKSLEGPLVEPVMHPMGSHGYSPDTPGYRTAFIMSGRGVKQGLRLPEIDLVDEAPTVAHLLGLEMPGVEGHVLKEALVDPQ